MPRFVHSKTAALKTQLTAFRKAGLSGAKTKTLKAIAAAVDGDLGLARDGNDLWSAEKCAAHFPARYRRKVVAAPYVCVAALVAHEGIHNL